MKEAMSENRVSKTHWPSYARRLKREAKQALKDEGTFNSLLEKARTIEDPYYKSQALAWIARRMAAQGIAAEKFFSESIKAAKKVEQGWRRGELLVSISSEMLKGKAEDVGELLEAVEDMPPGEHRTAAYQTIHNKIKRSGVEPPPVPEQLRISKIPHKSRGKEFSQKRLEKTKEKRSIGLYNTYKGSSLQAPHIRAIARAAPLCHAFNLNLILFSFPAENIEDIVEAVERETAIGGGGKYLRTLQTSDRAFHMKIPDDPIIPGVGEIIATTSNPDRNKRVDLKELIDKDENMCFLMGLGSEGLPKKILDLTRRHLELTGKDVPLETCTAIGVLAAKISLL